MMATLKGLIRPSKGHMALTVVCESFVAGAERPLAWLQPSGVWLHFHSYEECTSGLADIVMTKEWLSTSMVLSHLP